ncbi:MAG: glycosyltransferase [Thermaerobacter sp.]|nr:glycosyltransferase [Thermaerobacter sp.]
MANSRERVSLVIPAYNEADTIGPVLDVVRSMPDIDQVIVVSDGSTDATAVVARMAGARVVELPTNQGKGAAMHMGVEAAQGSDVIVFLDADLVGLTPAHVRALLEPVLSGEVEATVGVFEGGRVSTDLALALAPFLSGQRALRRHLMEKVAIGDSRFGVELALNRALKRRGVSIREVVLQDLSQVMKEEKMGLAKGLAARMRMYWEIIREIPRI